MLREWPYVSVHLMAHAAAAAVVALLQPGWPRPAWATLARDERSHESLLAIYLPHHPTAEQMQLALRWRAQLDLII